MSARPDPFRSSVRSEVAATPQDRFSPDDFLPVSRRARVAWQAGGIALALLFCAGLGVTVHHKLQAEEKNHWAAAPRVAAGGSSAPPLTLGRSAPQPASPAPRRTPAGAPAPRQAEPTAEDPFATEFAPVASAPAQEFRRDPPPKGDFSAGRNMRQSTGIQLVGHAEPDPFAAPVDATASSTQHSATTREDVRDLFAGSVPEQHADRAAAPFEVERQSTLTARPEFPAPDSQSDATGQNWTAPHPLPSLPAAHPLTLAPAQAAADEAAAPAVHPGLSPEEIEIQLTGGDATPVGGDAWDDPMPTPARPRTPPPTLDIEDVPTPTPIAPPKNFQPAPREDALTPTPIAPTVAPDYRSHEPSPFSSSQTYDSPPLSPPTPPKTRRTATPAAATAVPDEVHEVTQGDNYWTISRRYYGSARFFAALAEYNRRRIPQPEKMRPGMYVLIPPIEQLHQRYPQLTGGGADAAESADQQQPGFFVDQNGHPCFRVGKGDTLTTIAEHHLGRYGRWVQLYHMNRDRIPDPNALKIGTVLLLPSDASQVSLVPIP